MRHKHKQCLVLNADYTPLGIIDWKKAMVWSFKYIYNSSKMHIEIIDYYDSDYIVGANNKTFLIPAVIKTNKYFKVHTQSVTFSRKNLFIRDNFTCQYCGEKNEINKLTYDHVIPKSKWQFDHSPTNWTNIVTACVSCNLKKKNRTPSQANMPLRNHPVVPQKSIKYLPVSHHISTIKSEVPDQWKIYFKDFQ
jgi:hypothetical protein